MRVLAAPFCLLLPLVASGILIDDGSPGRRLSAIEPTPVPPDAKALDPKRRHQSDHARMRSAQCESKFDCREGDTCYPDGQCRSLGKPYKRAPKPKNHVRPDVSLHKASPDSSMPIPKPGSFYDYLNRDAGDEKTKNYLDINGLTEKPDNSYDYSGGNPLLRSESGEAGDADIFDGVPTAPESDDMSA